MSFEKSSVSAPQTLIAGSCQAQRIHASLSRVIVRVEVTPEWREAQELKQLANERERALWQRNLGTPK